MNEKLYRIFMVAAVAVGLYLIYRVIKDSQEWIGDNPAGAVGGDTTDTGGWLTQWYLQTSGNADSKVYDPLGLLGAPNLGNDTIESWVDPFGWWF